MLFLINRRYWDVGYYYNFCDCNHATGATTSRLFLSKMLLWFPGNNLYVTSVGIHRLLIDLAWWNWISYGQPGVSSAPLVSCLVGPLSISSSCLLVLAEEEVSFALTMLYTLKSIHISSILHPFLIARLLVSFPFSFSSDTACFMWFWVHLLFTIFSQ